MTEQEFLAHHQLTRNPFADEDAQTDSVFREFCIAGTFHPSWSKVVGDAKQPATAVVFGPKGSGKTAIRLQLVRHVTEHNQQFPESRVFLIEFDDFNSYLGPLQEHLPRRHQSSPDRVLQSLRLWDHMDAILSQSITQLVDRVLQTSAANNAPSTNIRQDAIDRLDRGQRRDLLLLTASYDRSKSGTLHDRFSAIRKRLRFYSPSTWQPLSIGIVLSIVALWLSYFFYSTETISAKTLLWLFLVTLVAAWGMYGYRWLRHQMIAMRVCRNLRVIRNLFRFLYRLITEHCKRFRSETPQFKISSELFESTLAVAQAEDRRQ